MYIKNELDTLLNLDGVIIEQAGGHWTKFEVRQVPKTKEMPHGIRYSLTLHNRYGERVLGFDNAHAVRRGKRHGRLAYDHRHRYTDDEGLPYEFIDAHQLLKDFWLEVDRVLTELGVEAEETAHENY